MHLKSITLYPIKSLGGVSVTEAEIDTKGLRYDRRYMLVGPDGIFITQRSNHHMALIDVRLDQTNNTLHVWHRHAPADELTLPLVPDLSDAPPMDVTIWASEDVPARLVSDEADAWFSRVIGKPCRLVYMPDDTRRPVLSGRVRAAGEVDRIVSFADGLPILLANQSSLDELNRRAGQSLSMARFRPNLVTEGGCPPHDEDTWAAFQIGEASFYGVKPCIRCVLTTIDPATGERGPEPLKTLATYRRHENQLLFGENVMPAPSSVRQLIRVGDVVTVGQRKTPWLPVAGAR